MGNRGHGSSLSFVFIYVAIIRNICKKRIPERVPRYYVFLNVAVCCPQSQRLNPFTTNYSQTKQASGTEKDAGNTGDCGGKRDRGDKFRHLPALPEICCPLC